MSTAEAPAAAVAKGATESSAQPADAPLRQQLAAVEEALSHALADGAALREALVAAQQQVDAGRASAADEAAADLAAARAEASALKAQLDNALRTAETSATEADAQRLALMQEARRRRNEMQAELHQTQSELVALRQTAAQAAAEAAAEMAKLQLLEAVAAAEVEQLRRALREEQARNADKSSREEAKTEAALATARAEATLAAARAETELAAARAEVAEAQRTVRALEASIQAATAPNKAPGVQQCTDTTVEVAVALEKLRDTMLAEAKLAQAQAAREINAVKAAAEVSAKAQARAAAQAAFAEATAAAEAKAAQVAEKAAEAAFAEMTAQRVSLLLEGRRRKAAMDAEMALALEDAKLRARASYKRREYELLGALRAAGVDADESQWEALDTSAGSSVGTVQTAMPQDGPPDMAAEDLLALQLPVASEYRTPGGVGRSAGGIAPGSPTSGLQSLASSLDALAVWRSLGTPPPPSAGAAATTAAATLRGSRSHSGLWARRMRARYSSVGSAVAPDTAEDQLVE
jgi:SWI/SNF-related matrix-associated actin-dependent regulator 1 of chromatin subfamily A